MESISLPQLTTKHYNSLRQDLVSKLQLLHDKMQELVVLSLQPKPPCCNFLRSKKKDNQYATVVPSELSEAAFRDLRILDAHNTAAARLRNFTKTRIGKSQIQRLSSALWAQKQRLLTEYGVESQLEKEKAEIQYIFERLASSVTKDGIDVFDIDFLEQVLLLQIKKNDVPKVVRELNASETGFVELVPLTQWIMEGKHTQYVSSLRKASSAIAVFWSWIFGRV